MKNYELLDTHSVIMNIPMSYNGKELSSKLQARIILMKVSYDKAVNAFNGKLKEVMEQLKPEGFNDLLKAVQKMEAIRKKSSPSKEEIEEAKKIESEILPNYKLKEKALIEKYIIAREEELEEEATITPKKLSEFEYEELVEVIGASGEMELVVNKKTIKLQKEDFLSGVAALLVE